MSAPIRSVSDLIAGLRDCVHQRGVAYQTVDDIAGLPDRYTSKILAPRPLKKIGLTSFEGIIGAVGKMLILVDDPEQIKRVKARWVQSKRPFKQQALSIALSIANELQITPELQAQLAKVEFMKSIGKTGGKRRMKTMGKRARQRAASHAARMRWSKRHA